MPKRNKPKPRDRSGHIMLSLPPEMAKRLRDISTENRRPISQQVLVWIEPHLKA